MADADELMGIFNNLITEKRQVRLYNTYRGLPFSHPAEIIAIQQGKITARVHRHNAVSMALEGRTHLQESSLPEIIRANSVEVDFKSKQVLLGDFTRVGDRVGKRVNVRVQPSESLEADLYDGRKRIRGRIADMSTNGLCVFTFHAFSYGLFFDIDRQVFISFKPPNLESIVHFSGVITNINNPEGSFLHRIGLKIFPNPAIEPLLVEYITHQQGVIMQEIEQTYAALCQ